MWLAFILIDGFHFLIKYFHARWLALFTSITYISLSLICFLFFFLLLHSFGIGFAYFWLMSCILFFWTLMIIFWAMIYKFWSIVYIFWLISFDRFELSIGSLLEFTDLKRSFKITDLGNYGFLKFFSSKFYK